MWGAHILNTSPLLREAGASHFTGENTKAGFKLRPGGFLWRSASKQQGGPSVVHPDLELASE